MPLKEDIEAMMPKDDLMMVAWLDCLHWAIGERRIVDAFRADTGMAWVPAKNALERMIDEATGADEAFLVAFIPWFHKNIWGESSHAPHDGI